MLFRYAVFAVAMFVQCGHAAAHPTLYVDPRSGFARLSNDPAPLSHTDRIVVQSFDHRLLPPADGLIPDASYDLSGMPEVISFTNVPAGSFDLGAFLQPDTAISGLGISYIPLGGDFPLGGVLVEVPEPSVTGMAAWSLFAAAAIRRRSH